MLIYDFLFEHSLSLDGYPTILSQLSMENKEYNSINIHDGKVNSMPSLQSEIEEADLRFPMHALESARAGHKKCVVISNDTDVIVALLFHYNIFHQEGLEELWVKAGIGNSTRFIPLHILHQKLGPSLSKVLPAVHSLTGSDITSKVGTKKAALKADPAKYLQGFGTTAVMHDSITKEAEKYLVNVVDSRCKEENFNQLRAYIFHHSKGSSLQNLPPTSQGLLPHIQRAHFNTYTITHILDRQLGITFKILDPLDNGFINENGCLVPKKGCKVLEKRWDVVCGCGKCARQACPCRTQKVKCSKFCKCRLSKGCKNPYK